MDLSYPARQGLSSDVHTIFCTLYMMFFSEISAFLDRLDRVTIDSPLDDLVEANDTRKRLEEFLGIVDRGLAKTGRVSQPVQKDLRTQIVKFLSKSDKRRPDWTKSLRH